MPLRLSQSGKGGRERKLPSLLEDGRNWAFWSGGGTGSIAVVDKIHLLCTTIESGQLADVESLLPPRTASYGGDMVNTPV